MKKAIATIAALALIGVSCSEYNDERGKGDAPVGDRNESPRAVYFMPDGFANVAVFCDGTTRVYVTTREAAVTVSPDHPECDR